MNLIKINLLFLNLYLILFLNKFKTGVYKFYICLDSYIGSTNNLYQRCFNQHKNYTHKKTSKHKLFYSKVIKHGWEKFYLNILYTNPNHLYNFIHPNFKLAEEDKLILLN